MAGFEILLVVMDAVAQIDPHPLPEVAPAKLVDQFPAIVLLADSLKHGITHFRQRQHPVADVGRETGDGTVEVIAAFGISARLNAGESGVSGLSTSADRAEGPPALGKLIRQQLFQSLPGRKVPRQITADRG